MLLNTVQYYIAKRRNKLRKHFKKRNSAISYYWIIAVIRIVSLLVFFAFFTYINSKKNQKKNGTIKIYIVETSLGCKLPTSANIKLMKKFIQLTPVEEQ